MSRTTSSVSHSAVVTTWTLSLIGLAISAYLTFTHFEGTQYLACSSTGVVDCGAVTTSAQSYFLGIPVALLGLAHYAVMAALNSPWGWRAKPYWLHVLRFALAIGAMIFVLWLVAAELLIINHICLWCTGVHLVTFVLLIVLSRICPRQLGWIRSETP